MELTGDHGEEKAPILYLSHSTIPSNQANSIQVMRMCEALAEKAGPVELLCRAGDSGEEPFTHYGVAPRFRIHAIRAPRTPLIGRLAYTALALLKLLLRPRPRLLYARDPVLLGVLAKSGLCRAPIMLEVHQPPQDRLERALMRAILGSSRFAGLVVISRALGEHYRELFGAALEGRVVVAPDAAALPPAVPEPSSDPARPFRLGYAGSLSAGKGIERMVLLAERMPDVELEVIGGSPADVAAFDRPGGPPNLRLRGFLPPAEVQGALARCDVLLAPYQERVAVGRKGVDVGAWMSPLKIFEAMAAGRPILASDLPVVREVLRDGHNALLAPPRDLEAWIRCVRRLQQDAQLRRGLAERARKDLEEHYTWDRRAARVLAALEG